MFQLDAAISHWKKTNRSCEAISSDALDELESHLRDSVTTLAESGLDEEEAFLVATHRLGSTHQLASEYDKVHQSQVWLSRTILMLSGYLLLSLFFKFIALDQMAAGVVSMIFGVGSKEIHLPLMGQDYQLHMAALIHGLTGFIGLGILAWIIMSFAKGKWQAQPKKIWVLLACWSVASLAIGLLHCSGNLLMVQRVSVEEYGAYMSSNALIGIVYQIIATVMILVFTAVLSRRYFAVARSVRS